MQVHRKTLPFAALAASCLPYLYLMRWRQPVGAWLLFWPCGWSLTLAAIAQGRGGPDIRLLVLFAVGAWLMRSAGCVINDVWDQRIDAQVARTQTRPLASGALTRQQALGLLLLLLLAALAVALQLNRLTLGLALLALPLVAIYPAMKRFTWWPQAFLGLTFNFGALMGWAAANGELAAPAFWLYLAGIFWTLGYDTIYAQQDVEDDARIGVKSTALLFGRHSRRWVSGFYLAMLAALGMACAGSGMSIIAISATLLITALHLGWQLYRFDPADNTTCARIFRSNSWLGAWLFLALLSTFAIQA